MSTPAVTPANPLAEFGGVSVDASNPTAQSQAPSNPSTNPLAEFGGVVIPDQNENTKVVPPEVIASDATKVPNARLRNMPNPAEGMTPGQALYSGAKTGTELAAIPASPAAIDAVVGGIRAIPNITEALLNHAETKAGEWAAQYPNLIKIASHLGIPTSTAAVLGWLYHNSKSK